MLGEPVVVRSGAPGNGVPCRGAAPVGPPLVGEGEAAGGGGVHHAAVTHVPGGQALLSAGVWSCIQHCSSRMEFLEKKNKFCWTYAFLRAVSHLQGVELVVVPHRALCVLVVLEEGAV